MKYRLGHTLASGPRSLSDLIGSSGLADWRKGVCRGACSWGIFKENCSGVLSVCHLVTRRPKSSSPFVGSLLLKATYFISYSILTEKFRGDTVSMETRRDAITYLGPHSDTCDLGD